MSLVVRPANSALFHSYKFISQYLHLQYAAPALRIRHNSSSSGLNSADKSTVVDVQDHTPSKPRPMKLYTALAKMVSQHQPAPEIDNNDLQAAWVRVKEADGGRRIHRMDLHQMSRSVFSVLREWVALEVIDAEDKAAAEGLAVVFAAAGDAWGLFKLMGLHLKAQNPSAVLFLYEKYEKERLHRSDIPGITPHPKGKDLDMVDEAMHGSNAQQGDMIMAVTAAYAMQNNFPDALHLSLQHSTTFLRPSSLQYVLEILSYDTELCERIKKFIANLEIAKLIQRGETSLTRQVNNNVRHYNVNALTTLQKDIVDGIRGDYAFIALEKKAVSHYKPLVLPPKTWSLLISAYLFCRKEDLAEALWLQLMEMGVPRGILEWNALLEGYRDMGAVLKIISTWDLMKADRIKPNSNSYCAKISAYYDAKMYDEARLTFKEFKQLPFSDEGRLPVYNAALKGLSRDFGSEAMLNLFAEMKEKGPKPDLISYNTVLYYYSRRRESRRAISLLEELEATGLKPDVISFTTLLSTFLRSDVPDAFQIVRDIMHKRGVRENVATYSAMINYLVNEGSVETLKAAFNYLDKMEHLPNAHPNEITYTTMMAGIHRNKMLDGEETSRLTDDIVQRMVKRGFKLKRGTYHLLLAVCLQNPKPEGLKAAMEYVNKMRRGEVPFSHDTWYTILEGLQKRREWKVANEMVDVMLHSGFKPAPSLLQLIRSIREMKGV